MANMSFERSVKRRNPDREPISFDITAYEADEDGEPRLDDNGNPIVYRSDTFTLTNPTEEQVLLLLSSSSENSTIADQTKAVFDLFRDLLPVDQYRVFMRRFRDPEDVLDVDLLMDIVEGLVEVWQDFPTQQRSASSASRKSTGRSSTGRAPGKGSTRSTSR